MVENKQRMDAPTIGPARKMLRAALTFLAVPIIKATVLERTVRTHVDDFQLIVHPGVFHPRFFFSSMLLGRYVSTLQLHSIKVLDMGTGSGVIGLYAASRGAYVTAVDLNPAAVQCAKENVLNLGFESRMTVLLSDLFDVFPEGDEWQYIFWNPPFYPRPWRSMAEAAWNAGENYEVIRRFARDVRSRLSVGGEIFLVLSSEMDIQRILDFFSETEFIRGNLLSKSALWETFHIYRFTKR